MTTNYANQDHYQRIAAALPLLAGDCRGDWRGAAAAAGLSPYYFQRVFKRHVGVSPRQYAACLTLADVRARLAAGESVLAAAVDSGLSGGGRAHDLFISMDAITPGQDAGGAVTIQYGFADSPFGRVFIAVTARGVCFMQFADAGAALPPLLAALRRRWRHARLAADDAAARRWARRMFAGAATPLAVCGTNFQIKVWQALLRIPSGTAVSYRALAQAVCGRAGGARAVAGAAAANPVAVLIPCHRLLGAGGALTGYAWGLERKRALLAAEFAAADLAALADLPAGE